MMQRVEAIIRPEKLLDVKAALERLGYGGMTVTEVKGFGTQRGVMEEWQGSEFWIEFLPKIWFMIVVDDNDSDEVIDCICSNAATGDVGDGKIFVSEVRDAIRVRTRERGADALIGGTPVTQSL
jgi:nitrogen regulatory protein P-II 1